MTRTTTKRLGRRGFLRGALVGGATVSMGLPFLESIARVGGRARADEGDVPTRFLVWFWGNGILPDRWVPSATGTDWVAPALLAPLATASLRSRVSVVTNTEVRTSAQPHAGGAAGILTGAGLVHPEGDNGTPGGASIDQLVADALGPGAGGLRSLGVAPHFAGASGSAYNYISHRGPDAPNPYDRDPRSVFRRLFLGAAPRDPYDTFRGSVLNAVMSDAASLSPTLTTSDRARLDQHLTSVRELELRIASLGSSCGAPADPAARVSDAMMSDVRTGEQNLTMLNEVMSELLAMALACDATRVASYTYTGPAAFTRYHEVASLPRDGYAQPDPVHGLSHNEAGDQPQLEACIAESMRHFAATLEALARIPEGEGTLLDHCAVLGTSCTSFGRSHSHDEYPVIVAGGGGGALRGGLHHRFATAENASRVPLTLAHAVGAPLASFGAGAGLATDPITELLA